MSVPKEVIAEAKVKWPQINNETKILVANRESLIMPKMKAQKATFDLDAITARAAERVAWYLGEGDIPESGGEYTLLKLTPEPFIKGWLAIYDPDEDIVVFRQNR
jgi:hypothetical protein